MLHAKLLFSVTKRLIRLCDHHIHRVGGSYSWLILVKRSLYSFIHCLVTGVLVSCSKHLIGDFSVFVSFVCFCIDGELLQVRENEYCLLEIPKGTAELGLRVTAVPELKGVSGNY